MNVPHNERVYEALGFSISLALVPNSLTQFNSVQLSPSNAFPIRGFFLLVELLEFKGWTTTWLRTCSDSGESGAQTPF